MLNKNNTILTVIDVQGKLSEIVYDSENVIKNIGNIVEGFNILDMPIVLMEQYPKGLGLTNDKIKEKIKN